MWPPSRAFVIAGLHPAIAPSLYPFPARGGGQDGGMDARIKSAHDESCYTSSTATMRSVSGSITTISS